MRKSSARTWALALTFVFACGPATPEVVEPPVIEIQVRPAPVQVAPSFVEEETRPRPLNGEACIEALIEAKHLTTSSDAASRLFVDATIARKENRISDARKRLLELTKNHKQSLLIPHAYLLFGEMFFEDAVADPSQWSLAANFYTEVLKYPFPSNRAFFYTANRLGEVYQAQDEHQRALAAFSKVLRSRTSHPDEACIPALAPAARRGTVSSYAKVGALTKAFAFFKMQVADPMNMMVELVEELARDGDRVRATQVAEGVLARNPNASVCSALADVTTLHGLSVAPRPGCTRP